MRLQQEQGINDFVNLSLIEKSWLTEAVVDPLHTFDTIGTPVPSRGDGPFLPRWLTSPVLQTSMVNENLFEKDGISQLMRECIATRSAILGGFHSAKPGSTSHPDPTTSFFATLLSMWEGTEMEYLGDPMSHIAIPIFDSVNSRERMVVGVVKSTIYWQSFLRNILPKNDHGITVVVENLCDGSYTYQLDGPEVRVIGFGNRHDRKFSAYRVDGWLTKEVIEDGTAKGIFFNQSSCPYTFHVYPAQEDYDYYITNEPVVMCLAVASVFVLTIGLFLGYDRIVERRQRLVLAKATQSTAIVSSLFVSFHNW